MPARRNRAFTLVELIAAATITVLVAGATVGMLRSILAARGRVDEQMALQQEARAAVQAMATALRNACRGSDAQATLVGINAHLGDMPADRVRFFTVSRRVVRPGEPESDVKECEFRLVAPRRESAEGVLPALVRRTDPTRNPEPDGGGVVEHVARNVLGLDLAYHDGAEWRKDWPEKKQGWPLAVRIELTVADGDARGARRMWTTSRVVSFPHLVGRRPDEAKEQPK